jgi:hypothetical protein
MKRFTFIPRRGNTTMRQTITGSKIAFVIGATIGVIIIKREPDGNLLVTSVCAMLGGIVGLFLWKLVK